MELGLLYIGLGIAAFGYFIGDGLKNFKNPNAKNFMDHLEDEEGNELIKERHAYEFLGIDKGDAEQLIAEYPTIPHVFINNNIYYPKEALRNWLKEMGNKHE